MNSSEYIISRLKQLACNIPNIQIRYEFRIITQTHIVEVLPLIFFKENEQYINEEVKLETDFEQLYPSENIVFISESSLTEIRNPEFEIGYSRFEFDIDISTPTFSVEAYSVVVDNEGCEYYALAA